MKVQCSCSHLDDVIQGHRRRRCEKKQTNIFQFSSFQLECFWKRIML